MHEIRVDTYLLGYRHVTVLSFLRLGLPFQMMHKKGPNPDPRHAYTGRWHRDLVAPVWQVPCVWWRAVSESRLFKANIVCLSKVPKHHVVTSDMTINETIGLRGHLEVGTFSTYFYNM